MNNLPTPLIAAAVFALLFVLTGAGLTARSWSGKKRPRSKTPHGSPSNLAAEWLGLAETLLLSIRKLFANLGG